MKTFTHMPQTSSVLPETAPRAFGKIPVNPFSTRLTRPGQIASLNCGGHFLNPNDLIDRLQFLGGTAVIQGPHGSGKTTLLMHLSHELASRGDLVACVRLRSSRDALVVFRSIIRSRPGTTLCLDSWEQAGFMLRKIIWLAVTVRRCGLLVTCHRPTTMPVLMQCQTSPLLLKRIVEQLPNHEQRRSSLIHEADIQDAFLKCGGNIRESLYDLYDRFEQRVRLHPHTRT